jgi:hypothetical protein
VDYDEMISCTSKTAQKKEAELDQGCHLLSGCVSRLENAVSRIATVLMVALPDCAENPKRPIPPTVSHVIGATCEEIDLQTNVLEALTNKLQDVVGDIKILG